MWCHVVSRGVTWCGCVVSRGVGVVSRGVGVVSRGVVGVVLVLVLVWCHVVWCGIGVVSRGVGLVLVR